MKIMDDENKFEVLFDLFGMSTLLNSLANECQNNEMPRNMDSALSLLAKKADKIAEIVKMLRHILHISRECPLLSISAAM